MSDTTSAAGRRVPKLTDRTSGVLLHPTSLPAAGELGPPARAFIDFLARAGQRWWQMLPVAPPGYGESPYSAESAFAGSPKLVSGARLVDDGLLPASEVGAPKHLQLRTAFDTFRARASRSSRDAFDTFCARECAWLDEFALFHALKRAHGDVAWTDWEPRYRDRDPAALRDARGKLADEIALAKFVQHRFALDWADVRAHAASRGIGLIGDIPIFVAHDSADVWQHRELFHLDDAGQPALIAGVPPDYFSATGQRWGNPLYRWPRLRKTGYRWWIDRMRITLERFDAVRLDHFIGFQRYWEVKAHEPTAMNGRWMKGPGAALFAAMQRELGPLPLIAEDLGAVTPAVRRLRDRFGFPGIKLLQFAFGTDPNAHEFLPHNYPRNAVVYPGTHDNDTTVGWFHDPGGAGQRSTEQTEKERRIALAYLGAPDANEIHWRFIRACFMSVANVAIVPMQDLLGLGSAARMNRPGIASGNWLWRAPGDALSPALADRLRDLTWTYDRQGPDA